MTKAKKLETKIEYYSNGTIECVYGIDENGKRQGPYESYYQNGQPEVKCAFKDEKYDGPYEAYYENGKLAEKCTYKDAEKDGPAETYDKNGKLLTKGLFKNGYFIPDNQIDKERNALNKRLDQINEQMEPTSLRQRAKRAEVAQFRTRFPNKNDGR